MRVRVDGLARSPSRSVFIRSEIQVRFRREEIEKEGFDCVPVFCWFKRKCESVFLECMVDLDRGYDSRRVRRVPRRMRLVLKRAFGSGLMWWVELTVPGRLHIFRGLVASRWANASRPSGRGR